jgi:hypothetical protein
METGNYGKLWLFRNSETNVEGSGSIAPFAAREAPASAYLIN